MTLVSRNILAAASVALLCACASGGDFETALAGHEGLTERELVRKFGPPLDSMMEGERKLLSWGPTPEVYLASVAPGAAYLRNEAAVLPIAGDTRDGGPFARTCAFTYELVERDVMPARPATEPGGVQFVAVAWLYDAETCG